MIPRSNSVWAYMYMLGAYTNAEVIHPPTLTHTQQVMFEKYQCAGVYIAIQAVLTLYAQGGWKSHDLLLGHMTCRKTYHSVDSLVSVLRNDPTSPYGTPSDIKC